MADTTGRWQRISRPHIEVDSLHAMRVAIAEVRSSPRDLEARRQLRALGVDAATRDQLVMLLTDEVHAEHPTEVAAAFWEELADVYENLDHPLETITAMEAVVALEPDDAEHLDRLAWLYRRAGALAKAAETFERVAAVAHDDRARAALHAAGRLYRDTAKLDRAVEVYRQIVDRRPADREAWQALDEMLNQLGRWRELADVRGVLAARASGEIEKAALFRAQARALEQAGDARGAEEAVARASGHAPDDVSGLVDYAMVLARGGRGREAADVLAARVSEAIERGAPGDDIAALRARHAAILEDACGDRDGAAAVLGQLLADAPDYVPALERLVWQAQHDPDPLAYPAALLRHAHALAAGPDKAALLVEAARKYRDAHDHRAAIVAYEAASELVPDEDLRSELDDVRTAAAVARAAAESDAGDVATAQRRLRQLLASHPGNLEASVALADLLKPAEACEHLRDTLAQLPAPNARLVHRYALATAALGEVDAAHQLLHDAHALDRRDLLITLALGESCYQRRLWREAALHLGALADHPDAPRHARAVAAGLVHAALAEVRALRPGNAEKRYEAAIRLDPECARAWHELAELAVERGDSAKAADYLEREALATTEPAERLRLFDALGDFARDVLDDVARAERCWMQVVDLGSTDVLGKLLAVQRKRGATIERGEVCERLAELDRNQSKELAEEAAQAFAAGGDHARARAVAQRLVAAHPQDVDAIGIATAVWAESGDPARLAAWLARALQAWDAAGDRGDGDPRRAELWRRLGDCERARGNRDAATRAYERAVVIAPEADGALAARRGLVELGSGRSSGLLAALVEAEQAPADVLAWARQLVRGDRLDDARAAYELAIGLGCELDVHDHALLVRAPLKEMAADEAYATTLASHDLIDDPGDGPLGAILDVVGETLARVAPDARSALAAVRLADATRLSSLHDSAAAAMFPQIAKALGGPPTLLYATTKTHALRAVSEVADDEPVTTRLILIEPDELHERASTARIDPSVGRNHAVVVLAAPPIVVLGPAVLQWSRNQRPSPELRFHLGRLVELTRPRRVLAAGTTAGTFTRFVAAIGHAFGMKSDDRGVVMMADKLHSALSVQSRRKLADLVGGAGPLDPGAYRAACERAADRAGLIACGRADVALACTDGATHVARLAASSKYLELRRKLRRR